MSAYKACVEAAAAAQEAADEAAQKAFIAGLKELVTEFPEIKTIHFSAEWMSDDEGGSFLSIYSHINGSEEDEGVTFDNEVERLEKIGLSRWTLESPAAELGVSGDSNAAAIGLIAGDEIELTREQILAL